MDLNRLECPDWAHYQSACRQTQSKHIMRQKRDRKMKINKEENFLLQNGKRQNDVMDWDGSRENEKVSIII